MIRSLLGKLAHVPSLMHSWKHVSLERTHSNHLNKPTLVMEARRSRVLAPFSVVSKDKVAYQKYARRSYVESVA